MGSSRARKRPWCLLAHWYCILLQHSPISKRNDDRRIDACSLGSETVLAVELSVNKLRGTCYLQHIKVKIGVFSTNSGVDHISTYQEGRCSSHRTWRFRQTRHPVLLRVIPLCGIVPMCLNSVYAFKSCKCSLVVQLALISALEVSVCWQARDSLSNMKIKFPLAKVMRAPFRFHDSTHLD